LILPSVVSGACRDTGGNDIILNLHPVAIGINKDWLRAFVRAVEEIESLHRGKQDLLSGPHLDIFRTTDCFVVRYVQERDSYQFLCRGVYWETASSHVVEAVLEAREYLDENSGGDINYACMLQ